jgi:hypothetical protein
MQCLLPHEASTTCPAGTEPRASILLRRRRPKAVDRLAISSQSPFRVVGENFAIAITRADSLARDCIKSRSVVDDWGEREVSSLSRYRSTSCTSSPSHTGTGHSTTTLGALRRVLRAPTTDSESHR